MEYDDQPLQFINYNYFQVKDENDGTYQTISFLIFSMMQFPFAMPFISYATVLYIYPKICRYLEQHEAYIYNSSSTATLLTLMAFFMCLFLITSVISGILIVSHAGSMVEFINYCNKVLPDEDRNMPYVFAAFSGATIVGLFVVGAEIWLYKLTQLRSINSDNLSTRRFKFEAMCISMSAKIIISVNIIYILCYFSPFMILAFLHDPLVTFSTYFLIIIGISSFLTIVNHPVLMLIVLRSGVNARQQGGTVVKKCMAWFIVILMALSGYPLVTLIMFFVSILLIGNFGSSPTLQGVLLSLLIGLMSFWILKPPYKKVQREGLFNNDEREGLVNNDEREGLINNEDREDLINNENAP